MVIVGSILLAFALQAWWDERQERDRERDPLERLETEFVKGRFSPNRVAGAP